MRLLLRLIGWGAVASGLVIVALLVFAPTYNSPDSRLWSSGIGYPAVARKLGWAIPVETTIVERHVIESMVSADGVLEYEQLVPVNIEVPGIVQAINVEIGDFVAQGDSLIELDSGGQEVRAARLQLENEESEYEAAKRNLQRQEDALGKGLIPAEDIERYESDVRQSRASVMMAREKLRRAMMTRSQAVFGQTVDPVDGEAEDDLRVLSPTTGRVKQVNVSLGENLVSARAGAIVVGDRILFRSYFDQREFANVNVGDANRIHLLARPELEIKGTVKRIEPFVSDLRGQRDSGQPPLTFVVWTELNLDASLLDELATGMNGYCIVSRPINTLAIPVRALMRYSGGQGTVLIVNDDSRIELRPVQYEVSDDTSVAIAKGLQAGDRIVTSGQVGLVPGDLVNAQ